jgi:protein-disulfide isomerase
MDGFVRRVAIGAAAMLMLLAVAARAGAQAPETGPADAPVTIVEFVDFASEPSARLAFMLKALADTYPTEVRIVFKHDPSASHPEAILAHEAALAAAAQDKFWEMSDIVFSNQSRLQRADLVGMAMQLGLDRKRFETDLDSGLLQDPIDRDRQEAAGLHAKTAPVCVFNGKELAWPLTFDQLKALVDKSTASIK